jgi:hypothetical protein
MPTITSIFGNPRAPQSTRQVILASGLPMSEDSIGRMARAILPLPLALFLPLSRTLNLPLFL